MALTAERALFREKLTLRAKVKDVFSRRGVRDNWRQAVGGTGTGARAGAAFTGRKFIERASAARREVWRALACEKSRAALGKFINSQVSIIRLQKWVEV